jgi:hypothetical protein
VSGTEHKGILQMRAILFILILVVLALVAALATNLIDISQTRPARAPDVAASGKGISAKGGQTPAFDVETGSVSVGARQQNVVVPLPTVGINRSDKGAANEQQPPAENQQQAR